MMNSLAEAAKRMMTGHKVAKPLLYYEKYDDFLRHHRLSPKAIIEVGTYEGESTKIISTAFPESKILAIDFIMRDIDFSAHGNVVYEKADQRNGERLTALVAKHFPDGVDLVIDDASHIGAFSAQTFATLFPLLKSRGAYFVEDWGTGYWDDWVDGSRFQGYPLMRHDANIPKRIPSHDFGMVGFVKTLVDLTHETAIKNTQAGQSTHSSRAEVLEFGEGVCMLLKS